MFPSVTRKGFLKKLTLAISLLPLMPAARAISIPVTKKEELISKTLGRTGLKVRVVGMGATRTQEPAMVKAAVDAGVNFFDTGRTYANGKNEEMLGKIFKGIRNQVVIQSKLRIHEADRLNEKTVIQRNMQKMEESVNESLKALQTDYIDIMLLHGMDNAEVISHPEIMSQLDKFKKQGKIRAHGFSTHRNQAILTQWNNESLFYDVIMPAVNHRGGFVHSRSGREHDWDHDELIDQLKTAYQNDIGIVAMKIASGGNYKDPNDGTESMANAIKWVIRQEYISVVALAMVNFGEIEEGVGCMVRGL